jgi:enterochelin esterase-like enzyme
MSGRLVIIILIVSFVGGYCFAQTGQPPDDTQPSSTNIAGQQYPRIDSERHAIFRIYATQAQSVRVSPGNTSLTKGDDGYWTGTTGPLDAGFHYYQLIIDGVSVSDPASEAFYGTGKMSSAIEIPEKGADFYTIKDVLHGCIRSKRYFSKYTNSWRRLNVYTPPGYDTQTDKKYPVLYIQHGGGEDERGWAQQGKTDIILDNLIAENKAKPMVVIISNGNVPSQGGARGGYSLQGMSGFKEELINNLIPFVESNHRVLPGAENRALAGLSMGGGQAFFVGLPNADKFAWVGVFSTGLFGGIGSGRGGRGGAMGGTFNAEEQIPGLLSNSKSFNDKLKLFYISVGQQDPRLEPTKSAVATFRENGLKVEFASYPGGHEWQVWRKSLHDFASRLFK